MQQSIPNHIRHGHIVVVFGRERGELALYIEQIIEKSAFQGVFARICPGAFLRNLKDLGGDSIQKKLLIKGCLIHKKAVSSHLPKNRDFARTRPESGPGLFESYFSNLAGL